MAIIYRIQKGLELSYQELDDNFHYLEDVTIAQNIDIQINNNKVGITPMQAAAIITNSAKVGVQNNIIGIPELKPIFKSEKDMGNVSGVVNLDFSDCISIKMNVVGNITAFNFSGYSLSKSQLLCITFANASYTISGWQLGVNTANLSAFTKTLGTMNWVVINTLSESLPKFKLNNFVE